MVLLLPMVVARLPFLSVGIKTPFKQYQVFHRVRFIIIALSIQMGRTITALRAMVLSQRLAVVPTLPTPPLRQFLAVSLPPRSLRLLYLCHGQLPPTT
jgi:hypothetical protein